MPRAGKTNSDTCAPTCNRPAPGPAAIQLIRPFVQLPSARPCSHPAALLRRHTLIVQGANPDEADQHSLRQDQSRTSPCACPRTSVLLPMPGLAAIQPTCSSGLPSSSVPHCEVRGCSPTPNPARQRPCISMRLSMQLRASAQRQARHTSSRPARPCHTAKQEGVVQHLL